MKIFTASQIRACDAYTIKAANIRPADLMERAALACALWIKDNLPKDALFVILCGTGNNGGDGLALARLLHGWGYGVKAFLLHASKELSADCEENYARLKAIDADLVSTVEPDTFITEVPRHIIIIDAILGTGLSRPLEGWLASFISHINQLPHRKIAIDMPSGLPADSIPARDAVVLRADDTLSFQFYKRSFLHPETGHLTGRIAILDIELDETFIRATASQYRTIDREDMQHLYRPRYRYAHKGTYGSVLMAGGSYGKMGAMVLCATAALRSGAGLVTALVPECGYTIMQAAVPEVMCRTSGQQVLHAIDAAEGYTVGIGPGMDTDAAAAAALAAFLEQCKTPIVLDADALNIMARQPELLARLPQGSVLTPHPKEFTRLFGANTNSMIQLDHARVQAMRYNVNIVLKGHHTAVVTAEGDCWYNMTGNAGMATGGAGDVLTGIITGLMAQGYAPQDAALLGVYLHGCAGDLAAQALSQEALTARDITDHLGKAFLALQQ